MWILLKDSNDELITYAFYAGIDLTNISGFISIPVV